MMNHHTLARRAAALICVAALALCAAVPAAAESAAEQTLAAMTLDQKIGQLFIVRPEALYLPQYQEPLRGELAAARDADGDPYALLAEQPGYSLTDLTEEMRAGLAAYPVGGVAVFGANLASPEQLTRLLADLQAASAAPLFTAVDEEGGPVARLGNSDAFDVPEVGAMGDVGATGDPENARAAGRTIGGYITQYGLNLDFAPVADVNTNPENIVIGRRAFGSDPALVAQMVCAALEGLHESGAMGCIKHFPGHGDTRDDTHDGYVSVAKTWDELEGCELIPFAAALGDTDMVMAAHITLPNVTDDGLPASLSRQMIQGRLREEMGYDGVVITDAMEMGAVAENYASGEAAVLALQAGVDIVLMPADLAEAFEAMRSAVESGALSEARVNESALRVLRLKEKYGLLEEQ